MLLAPLVGGRDRRAPPPAGDPRSWRPRAHGAGRPPPSSLIDELTHDAVSIVSGTTAQAETWEWSVCEAIAALLERTAASESLTRSAFVEPFGAGPDASEPMMASLGAVTAALTRHAPPARRAPGIVHAALTGALWWIVARCAAARRLHLLPALAGQAAHVVLAPYLGAAAATGAVIDWQRGLHRGRVRPARLRS
jgi:hypothetical protein